MNNVCVNKSNSCVASISKLKTSCISNNKGNGCDVPDEFIINKLSINMLSFNKTPRQIEKVSIVLDPHLYIDDREKNSFIFSCDAAANPNSYAQYKHLKAFYEFIDYHQSNNKKITIKLTAE